MTLKTNAARLTAVAAIAAVTLAGCSRGSDKTSAATAAASASAGGCPDVITAAAKAVAAATDLKPA